jgi:hypothetical protein
MFVHLFSKCLLPAEPVFLFRDANNTNTNKATTGWGLGCHFRPVCRDWSCHVFHRISYEIQLFPRLRSPPPLRKQPPENELHLPMLTQQSKAVHLRLVQIALAFATAPQLQNEVDLLLWTQRSEAKKGERRKNILDNVSP